ncbi:MAG: hypothetical protein HUK26_09605 [Duodenibacillus sp.]|nr:hypothetical protein [Duodenibacillus sp.]
MNGITDLKLNINSIGCPTCRKAYLEKLKDYLAPKLGGLCKTCQERFERNPMRILDCKEDHDKLTDAPVLCLVKEGGGLMFLTADGHFVFEGRALDAWQRRPVTTEAEARHSATHVHMANMGIAPAALNAVTLGPEGSAPEAWLFVDPNCGWCRRMLENVLEGPGDGRRWHVVAAAVAGAESERLARRWLCAAASSPRVKAELLAQGPEALAREPQMEEAACRRIEGRLAATDFARRLLGVRSTPFIVAPDGRTHAGYLGREALEDFLRGPP